MALILEVLDRHTGEVRLRLPLGGSHTIGRGYDNDVVLDDPYADVHHARIGRDESGAFAVEDLGSVNGLADLHAGRHTRVTVAPDTRLRIGRTWLRFRDTDAPLPPALRDATAVRDGLPIPSWLTTTAGQLGFVGAAAAVFAWDSWLGTYGSSSASDGLNAALGFVIVLAAWAGIWAAVGRIAVHRSRFLGHLTVASAVFLAAILYGRAGEWTAFLLPDNLLAGPIAYLGTGLLVAALLAGHLRLASAMPRRRRWRAGLIAGGILLALSYTATYFKRSEFSDVPTYSATLKPFPANWLPRGTIEDFGDVEAKIRRDVDALADHGAAGAPDHPASRESQ